MDEAFHLRLFYRSFVFARQCKFTILFVSFKGLLKLCVIGLSLFVLSLLPLFLLIASVAQDLARCLPRQSLPFQPPLLFELLALSDLAFEETILDFLLVKDGLLLLGAFGGQVLLLLFLFFLQLHLVFLHLLLQLAFIVLFRHFAVQHELLVDGVAQCDIRRESR